MGLKGQYTNKPHEVYTPYILMKDHNLYQKMRKNIQ